MKPHACSLTDQLPLELREGAQHVEQELAGRRRCIEGLGDGPDADADPLEHFSQRDEIAQFTGKSVELEDQNEVKLLFPGVLQKALHSRALEVLPRVAVVHIGRQAIPFMKLRRGLQLLDLGGDGVARLRLFLGGNPDIGRRAEGPLVLGFALETLAKGYRGTAFTGGHRRYRFRFLSGG
ncbi:MAG: hypothetical protein ABII00_09100 [Elusimicrobiota bacterium]